MLKLVHTLVFLLPALFLAQSIKASAPKAAVYTGCKVSNTVALTFDDGPYINQTDISKMLVDKGAKGTFFVNGYNYECIYGKKVAARLQATYSAGHQICSHTWDHPDLTDLNATEIQAESNKIDVALQKILGITTQFIRPPYGSYNNMVRQVLYNKIFIIWDFDSGDSVGASVRESENAYDQAIASNVPTLLALNHETEETTVSDVLPYAIKKLQAAGYKLVTVAECLGMAPYTSVGPLGQRDATWFCPEERSGD
ncbi:carbohydrate esterase family 4 protein [Mycena olivaceomarginata]|nr:carbohydrate esterase family 4 protein [Mycena olivaceomarginata]